MSAIAGPSRSRSNSPPPSTPSRDPEAQNERAAPHSEDPSGDEAAPTTRRAMMSSAVAGLQRFKQSYVSIMVLKAGIGLGQVIALIILLTLASSLPSPLYPSQRQNQESKACPHPGLFEGWCITQIIRLTTCWSVSVWMLVRQERARRRAADAEEMRAVEEERAAVERQAAAREMASRRLMQPTPPDEAPRAPSCVHTDSTSSSGTLPVSTPPEKIEPPIEMAEVIAITKTNHLAVPALDQTAVRRSLQQARELAEGRPLSVASRWPNHPVPVAPASGFVGWMDRHALQAKNAELKKSISQGLGLLSTILFILGNILLFYPPPTSHSCYAASPMLWWGVMTVTAVGWVLFAQVFFVVIIVGLGGHVALSALRRAGLAPPPPSTIPERPARAEPLLPIEVERLKVVCYIPEDSPVVTSRLPHPPLPLPADKALCAICQENFAPPQQGRTIMLKADPLRLLGCGHVFHTGCIDQWLLQGSGNCPFCNRSVRETTLPTSDTSTEETPRRRKGWVVGSLRST